MEITNNIEDNFEIEWKKGNIYDSKESKMENHLCKTKRKPIQPIKF